VNSWQLAAVTAREFIMFKVRTVCARNGLVALKASESPRVLPRPMKLSNRWNKAFAESLPASPKNHPAQISLSS
jgi:hypothetical protein